MLYIQIIYVYILYILCTYPLGLRTWVTVHVFLYDRCRTSPDRYNPPHLLCSIHASTVSGQLLASTPVASTVSGQLVASTIACRPARGRRVHGVPLMGTARAAGTLARASGGDCTRWDLTPQPPREIPTVTLNPKPQFNPLALHSSPFVPAHTSLHRRDICQRGGLNPGALIPNVAAASTALEKGYVKAQQRSFITLRGIHM